MGDVIDFDGVTTNDIPVEDVLENAKGCDEVLVLGWKGSDFYCAMSNPQYSDVFLLLQIAQRTLMDVMLHTLGGEE